MIDLYRFDRKLRLLIFDAIERIEIGLRTQLIYQLSQKYGSHWHTKKSIFKDISYTDKKTGKTVTKDIYSEINKHIEEQLKIIKPQNLLSIMQINTMTLSLLLLG